MPIQHKPRWNNPGAEPGDDSLLSYQAGVQPLAFVDNWFNYMVMLSVQELERELSGRVFKKGNESFSTVTNTASEVKQTVEPDNDFIGHVEAIHVVCQNPEGSETTLYFNLAVKTVEGSTMDLLPEWEVVKEGETFDDYLLFPLALCPTNTKITEVQLKAFVASIPAAGFEPQVLLEDVLGIQN